MTHVIALNHLFYAPLAVRAVLCIIGTADVLQSYRARTTLQSAKYRLRQQPLVLCLTTGLYQAERR